MSPADILMASKNVPVLDPLAAMWGRRLAGRCKPTAVVGSKNLWSGENLILNKVLDSKDGVETENRNYVISDYFPSKHKLYTISFITSYEDWRLVSIALYDADKNFITLIRKAARQKGKWVFTFSTGESAYFRVSLFRLDEEVQLEAGYEATPYEPYN